MYMRIPAAISGNTTQESSIRDKATASVATTTQLDGRA